MLLKTLYKIKRTFILSYFNFPRKGNILKKSATFLCLLDTTR